MIDSNQSKSEYSRHLKRKTGSPLSYILRRAIDEYWERFEKKGKK